MTPPDAGTLTAQPSTMPTAAAVAAATVTAKIAAMDATGEGGSPHLPVTPTTSNGGQPVSTVHGYLVI